MCVACSQSNKSELWKLQAYCLHSCEGSSSIHQLYRISFVVFKDRSSLFSALDILIKEIFGEACDIEAAWHQLLRKQIPGIFNLTEFAENLDVSWLSLLHPEGKHVPFLDQHHRPFWFRKLWIGRQWKIMRKRHQQRFDAAAPKGDFTGEQVCKEKRSFCSMKMNIIIVTFHEYGCNLPHLSLCQGSRDVFAEPCKIFSYWEYKQTPPLFTRLNVELWRRHSKGLCSEPILINNQTVRDWIPDMPDEFFRMPYAAATSDLIRCLAFAKFQWNVLKVLRDYRWMHTCYICTYCPALYDMTVAFSLWVFFYFGACPVLTPCHPSAHFWRWDCLPKDMVCFIITVVSIWTQTSLFSKTWVL